MKIIKSLFCSNVTIKCDVLNKKMRLLYPSLPNEYFTCGVQGCDQPAVVFDSYFPYFFSYNCCSDHKNKYRIDC